MVSMDRIAGMNLHYIRYSLDYFLDDMVKNDIPNIELWGGFPHLYTEDATLSELKKLNKGIKARDLNLVCYTPEQLMYANNIASHEADVRKRSIDYYTENIEIAAELESPYMLMTAGTGAFEDGKEPAWNRSRESLRILSEKATTAGIVLLLEPLQPFESNLINNKKELQTMLKEVGSNSLEGMLDLVAMHVSGDEVTDYFNELESVRHIHFIDGAPAGHLALGEGTLPLTDYLKEIQGFGYEGYFSLELASSKYYIDPSQALKTSMDYLKTILK